MDQNKSSSSNVDYESPIRIPLIHDSSATDIATSASGTSDTKPVISSTIGVARRTPRKKNEDSRNGGAADGNLAEVLVVPERPQTDANSDAKQRLETNNDEDADEEIEPEPLGIAIFKWILMVLGTAMLIVVLYVMGEVIYAWISGTTEEMKMAGVFGSIKNAIAGMNSEDEEVTVTEEEKDIVLMTDDNK